MIFLQAAARPEGPAAASLNLVRQGAIELVISLDVIAEVRDVLTRPELVAKFPSLTPETVEAFVNEVIAKATMFSDVPPVVSFDRDPKDEKYLDLAIAGKVRYLISRDKDLLDLDTPGDKIGDALRL